MTKQKLTDEQKQVKQITARWNQRQLYMIVPMFGSLFFALFILKVVPWSPALGILIMTLVAAMFSGVIICAVIMQKKHLRELTPEEELLRASEENT